MRSSETAVGDWIAGLALKGTRGAPGSAQLALVNSGSLRLNQNLPSGTDIRRRHVEELVGPYNNEVVVLDISGQELTEVLSRSARCLGQGSWLQVSGVSFTIDRNTRSVGDVRVDEDIVSPTDRVRVATLAYLVDPGGDQDGYTMLDTTYVAHRSGSTIRELVARAVDGARGGTIAPRIPSPPWITWTEGGNPASPPPVCN